MTKYIKSPLNYAGGKYKILDYIIPTFPNDIKNFVDLFAGGLNVGINVSADTIYVNDQNVYLMELYKYFKQNSIDVIITSIYKRINHFDLNNSNTEGYLKLREEYNHSKDILDLFVLTCFSFNHQIRFNSRYEFNTPFGKNRSSYNSTIERNLMDFVSAIQRKNIIFSTTDFMQFDFNKIQKGDLVYCDPPYLITTGPYNDGKRGFKDWTIFEEEKLLHKLEELDERGVLFALSNVFHHKENTNNLLIEWSKNYNVSYIEKNYSNCSYHFKARNARTVEVLVTNYEQEEDKCQQMKSEI